MSEAAWKEVAFAPAPAGWYAVFAEKEEGRSAYAEEGRRYNLPIAGWLTMEDEQHTRPNRTVAAIPTPQGVLVPADSFGAAIPLVAARGPGQDMPE